MAATFSFRRFPYRIGGGLVGFLALAGLIVLIAGCRSGGSEATSINEQANVRLTRSVSCEELEASIKREAIRMIEAAYSDVEDCYRIVPLPGEPVDALLPSPPGSGGAQELSGDYSSTNVQEPGIDEPDIVKTDGEAVYVLSGSFLLIFGAASPQSPVELSRIELPGAPQSMLVSQDKVAVFCVPAPAEVPGGDSVPEYDYGLSLVLVDVSDKRAPFVWREIQIQGWLQSGRLIEDRLYSLVAGNVNTPQWDYSKGLEANEELVQEQSLSSWLPHSLDIVHGAQGRETYEDTLFSCDSFYVPDGEDLGMLLTVFVLDMKDPLAGPAQDSIFSTTAVAYASSESLFVTNAVVSGEDCGQHSRIHRFDLRANPGRATYTASGEVEGWLLNQFSMSEKDGFLRVATTQQPLFVEESPPSSNNVFILKESGTNLEQVGEVRGIAPGEQIYAVRFVGSLGFVVTFERVDPLFTLDLEDPFDPKLAGQLEVPGFSNYIHIADETHLLTIGKDTEDQGTFAWIKGMQVSLYDVSNLGAPSLLDMEIIGTTGTDSEALYDHRAFNYYAPDRILALPITVFEEQESPPGILDPIFSGFQVYRVDPASGLAFAGQLDHDEFYADNPLCYPNGMRRTLVLGDYLYTFSSGGMKVSPLDNISSATASVSFSTCTSYEPVPVPGRLNP
ncbi:MAG: beta-propeller domain-containing protein [Deltaproteobacteria bacterium]|nr:beta-propeller domain-containing protein [Deltaproteobacteria bacterium]